MKTSTISSFVPTRTIVLIGMMGAGKTSVGKRLAHILGLSFHDSDLEIEKASGMSVSDIFKTKGEIDFRLCEQKVIARLLDGPTSILSIGGGAFIDEGTRRLIKAKAHSVWLSASPDVLLERATRHGNRPLLQVQDPQAKMQSLLEERNPFYAEADINLQSDNRPVDVTAHRVLDAVKAFVESQGHLQP